MIDPRHYRDERDYKTRHLSGSTDGRGIAIAATTSPGTLIHTAFGSPAANEHDEITLYGVNNTGSAVSLTLQFGGTASADAITVSVPANSGLLQLVPGLPLHNGAEVRAYAASANAISMFGRVRRYEQDGM